jgi:hypothetical protein
MRARGYLAMGIAAGCLGALAWLLARPAVPPKVPEGPRVAGTRLFENVLTHVRSFGVDSIGDQELYRIAASGVLEELDDPYAVLLLPGQPAARGDEPAPQGMFLDRQDGLVVVVATGIGSAAETAGVRSGDRLVQVDSFPIDATRMDRAGRLLEGAPGSRVMIRVRREGTRTSIPLTLVRAEAPPSAAVEAAALPGSVGRVRVRRFVPGVSDSVRAEIEGLRGAGVRSLVLDLRRAVGGELADEVLVRALHDDGRGFGHLHGDPLGQRHHHRMGESRLDGDLLALQLGAVPDAGDFQLFREAGGHAVHHVGDERPVEAVHRPVALVLSRSRHR